MVFKTKFLNIQNVDFNIIIYILLVYAVFNAWWLSSKGIASGTLYISILTLGVVLVTFFNFIKIENKYKFASPFATSNNTAILRVYLGFILMLIILLIGGKFAATSVQAFQPLNSFKASPTEVNFSALLAQNSPFWTFNTVVIFASVFEEILIGVILVYIFYLILVSLFKNLNPTTALLIAIIIDIFVFAILHSFNSTYNNLTMYIIAGGFRLAGNIIIYFFGLGVEFMIGAHAANNSMFLGLDLVMSGLLSYGGIVFLIINILFIYILISTTDSWGNLFKSLSYKLKNW